MSRKTLGLLLTAHRHDSFSQDSGNHCICGSDSRFHQKFETRNDPPWENFGEHLADVAMHYLGVSDVQE